MFVVNDTIEIHAPIERCFLLSTSIDLVARTLGMKPVRGKIAGLVVANDRLTWKGWKFGLPQRHETLITQYNSPTFFQDSMASGRFSGFHHDHEFTQMGHFTLLKDTVRFSMPFGRAGEIAGRYILLPHIRDLVHKRFALLKHVAETDEWRGYLTAS